MREGTRMQIKDEVAECVIERIGQNSLTVTPFTFFARGSDGRELTLRYADIVNIELRGTARKSLVFAGGFSTGVILGFLVAGIAFRLGSE